MKILLNRLVSARPSHEGFTLAELLIVVTIIAVIGIASISGFSRMNSVQDMETLGGSISNTIESFDRDIIHHHSSSYETIFESGSIGFTTSVDYYQKHIPIRYAFDFPTASGSVETLGSGTGIIQLFFHSENALGDTMQVTESVTVQPFAFPKNIEKRSFWIEAFMSSGDTMNYVMQYYNLSNREGIPENEAFLRRIVGSDGTSYNGLIVRNVRGQKTILGSWVTLQPLTKATLTFEKNGQETELIIEP